MRRKTYHWLRHPKTTQEKRANQEGWCRGKRRPPNLADAYDDWPVTTTKSWKDKRKTQHYTDGRGQHHSIYVSEKCTFRHWHKRHSCPLWLMEDYFRKHNIPYRVDTVRKGRWYWAYWKRDWHRTSDIVGYVINWWSDKDIGIDFILRG